MPRELRILVYIAAILIYNHTCAFAAMTENQIREGLKAHQYALHITDDWIRDPYIIRAPDGFYYLTGTTQGPRRESAYRLKYNTGLGKTSAVGWKMKLWKSTDLVKWEYLGTPYSLKNGYWYKENREAFDKADPFRWRLWAPEIHFLDSKAVIIHTSPFPIKGGANFVFAQNEKVKGPWSHPLGEKIRNRHDPSLFQDDGMWWMIWGATRIAALTDDFSDYKSEPIVIGPKPSQGFKKMGHEGCLIRKIGRKYVLFGTGWSTGKMRKGSYNLYYATADKITGPYSERRFAGRFLGHGTPFKYKDGQWWCTAFYNANVPPLSKKGIQERDLGETAQTINQQGVTLVPIEVKIFEDGDVGVRVVDEHYYSPGPDEAQKFTNVNGFWK